MLVVSYDKNQTTFPLVVNLVKQNKVEGQNTFPLLGEKWQFPSLVDIYDGLTVAYQFFCMIKKFSLTTSLKKKIK